MEYINQKTNIQKKIIIYTKLEKAINDKDDHFLTAKEYKYKNKSYYKYYSFPDFNHFINYFQKLTPSEKRFHHVQTSQYRLFFYDIEIKSQDHIQSEYYPIFNLENFDKCLQYIISKTLQFFKNNVVYFVATNHRPIKNTPNDNYKYSARVVFHITTEFDAPKQIIETLFNNSENIDPNIYNMIDKSVYKKISNMRMPYNIKISSPNNPMLPIKNTTIKDIKNFITDPTFHQPLPHINIQKPNIPEQTTFTTLTPELEIKILKWLTKNNLNETYSIHTTNTNILRLDRMIPDHCPICQRIHDNDNAYIVLSSPLKFKCFRNPSKSIKMFKYNITTQKDKLYQYIINSTKNDTIQLNSNKYNIMSQKINYSSIHTYDFDKYDTIYCRSATGTSKTQALLKILNKLPNKFQKVLFITYRIALTNEISSNLPDFQNYLEAEYYIYDNKVICQIDSLTRIQLQNIDLVVLDEVESLFDEICKPNLKNAPFIAKKLQNIISRSKKMLILDAHMEDTNRIFEIISPLRDPTKSLFIDNIYKSKMHQKLNIYINENDWFNMLLHDLKLNKRIVIPTNTKEKALWLRDTINAFSLNTIKISPSIKVYTGDMSSEDRKNLSNINEEWSKYQIVIYTPCISAGNSFTTKHFDKLYAYFTNTSANYLQCLQMMYRSRNINDNIMEIMIKENNYSHLPMTIDEINKQNERQYLELIQTYNVSNAYEYINDVEVEFNKKEFFYSLILHHQLIENRNKCNFLYHFMKWITKYGTNIEVITELNTDFLSSDNYLQNDDIKRDQKISKSIAIEKIIKSPNITLDEYNNLCSSTTKTEDDKYSIEKKGLKMFYGIDNLNEKETEILLNKYNKPKIKKIYQFMKDLKSIDYENYPDVKDLNVLKEEMNINTIINNIASKSDTKNNRYIMHLEISKLFDILVEGDTLDCVWDREDIIKKITQYLTEDKINYLVNLFNLETQNIPNCTINKWNKISGFVNSIIKNWDIKMRLLDRTKSGRQKVIFENNILFNKDLFPHLK